MGLVCPEGGGECVWGCVRAGTLASVLQLQGQACYREARSGPSFKKPLCRGKGLAIPSEAQ